jgi:hypothetical protein
MLRTTLSLLAAALLSATAAAGDLSLAYAKHTKHGGFALQFRSGDGYAACGPVIRPLPRKVWTPGHFATVTEKVWVPATREKVWVEPVYATSYDACGRRSERIVSPGHWEIVTTPGHYETRLVKVWRPGCWT